MKRECVSVFLKDERKKDGACTESFLSTGCVFRLTCVEAVLVSGAVAVNGEGGASEGVGCCCCDNSELAPPTATAPVPDDDPSAPEKTPVEKSVL